jgi:hypothetical protein
MPYVFQIFSMIQILHFQIMINFMTFKNHKLFIMMIRNSENAYNDFWSLSLVIASLMYRRTSVSKLYSLVIKYRSYNDVKISLKWEYFLPHFLLLCEYNELHDYPKDQLADLPCWVSQWDSKHFEWKWQGLIMM